MLLRSVLLQEAKASSEIENVVTTNDRLYKALSQTTSSQDAATREVIAYSDALWQSYSKLQEKGSFDKDLIVLIASLILRNDVDFRDEAGCQVINNRTGDVVYTPPVGRSLISGRVSELCDFLNDADDNIDPLIKMAAAHYQFEAIHPFSDGNGRTGRILNILYLTHQGLLNLPVLYLSKFILQNRSAYYTAIRDVTEKAEWEPWVLFMLEATEKTALDTNRKLRNAAAAVQKAIVTARAEMKKGYSRELLDVVFGQPYTRVAAVVDAGIANRNTASLYLRDLERIGILRSVKLGRDVLYFNPSLAAALEIDFVE